MGMKIVAIVGMAGSGKSEVAREFEKSGYIRIRFGDITDEEVKKRGLVLNEASERKAREDLRRDYGMAAYAKLNIPKIDETLKKSKVVIDGLYSWEEYVLLKDYYGDALGIIAVWSPPKMRYERLSRRHIRSLTSEEARARDCSEIENINKGGPIAMADLTITNDSTFENLTQQTIKVIERLA
jgi:dephospho-CoA kinase